MTQTYRRAPHTSSPDGRRTRRPAHGSEREARARRVFDGVVASYIRDISAAVDVHDEPGQRRGDTVVTAESHPVRNWTQASRP
jgi:hypothetical protein